MLLSIHKKKETDRNIVNIYVKEEKKAKVYIGLMLNNKIFIALFGQSIQIIISSMKTLQS